MSQGDALSPSRVTVRFAVAADSARLLAWRNDPWIVAKGASGRTVSVAEHAAWFAKALEQRDTLLYIVEADGEPCGSVRFDLNEASWYISIFLGREWIGCGIGTTAFTNAVAHAFVARNIDRICALVVRSNQRSLNFFKRLGFEEEDALPTSSTALLVLSRPRVPHSRPFLGEEEAAAAAESVRSRQIAAGPRVRELEAAWSSLLGHTYAVGVGSGVGALRLALYALGVSAGDEVLVPAYACVALANAVLSLGGVPVYCDVQPGTWTINAADALRRRTSRSRAIIAVHTFGFPADVESLLALDLPIIEDCAHAVGKPCISTAARAETIAVGSFYATKLLGAGEGGIVSTNRQDIADLIRNARDYSDQAPDAHRLNDKMTDITAAIAACQCNKLPSMLELRAERARNYGDLLKELVDDGAVTLPVDWPGRVWYRYVVELHSALKAPSLVESVAKYRVSIAQPVWDLRPTTPAAALVMTNRAFDQLVSLPLYPDITAMEQRVTVEALGNGVRV